MSLLQLYRKWHNGRNDLMKWIFHRTDTRWWGEAVPLPRPQIQPAVSENRLTLARSYFTETAKQKNNSKARLSRKPAPKFNKWLFLSQCSHNCCSEAGMGVRQRLGWINCYRNQPRWTGPSRLWRFPHTRATKDAHTRAWACEKHPLRAFAPLVRL